MSDLENRIKLAIGWFEQHLSEDEQGNLGWGWVPDVPANPQNTAEVACVLSLLGEDVPEGDSILSLYGPTRLPIGCMVDGLSARSSTLPGDYARCAA